MVTGLFDKVIMVAGSLHEKHISGFLFIRALISIFAE